MHLLQLENVHKRFGDFTAVSDISFAIEKGSIYGLLGPNGAGKTTTLRMIMDIIAPDTGSITFSGNRHVRDFLDQIGYLPEERGLYRKMNVRDVILFIAELKGMYRQQALGEIENAAINILKEGVASFGLGVVRPIVLFNKIVGCSVEASSPLLNSTNAFA